MGLTATTTNLSYARNEYIKVGVSFIFDRVGDMIYYTLANNDIAMTLTNTLTIGASGTGYDAKFWGDTAANYFEWDADLDVANIVGSKSSQTTENNCIHLNLTTDSTYITGTNMTYSGARGSSPIKISGTYTGATGGFSALYFNIATSGAIATAGNGVVGLKGVVTNTAGMTNGVVYGAQFIAKHNHPTNIMTASASLIGCEAWAYISAAGPARTAIGGNFGWHNEATGGTYGAGSVIRGIQIFCDNNAGGNNPVESSGLCIWNQAGTITNAINVTQSGSGFTNLFYFSAASAPVAANTHTIDGHALQHILTVKIGSDTGYIPVFDAVPS